jgi:hypothetical protein
LDLGRVTSVDNVAANLLRELYERLAERGRIVRFAAVSEEVRGRLAVDPSALAPSAENALEDCEDALLRSLAFSGTNQLGEVPLGDFELVAALDPDELESLGGYLVKKTYAAGETIIKHGTAATASISWSPDRWTYAPAGWGTRRLRAWLPSTREMSSENSRSSATVDALPM